MQAIENTVNEIITQAAQRLTATPEAITKTGGVDTTPLLNSFQAFQTVNDPVLTKMLYAARTMHGEMIHGKPPRWLSFVGPSGVGKTFLAQMIFKYAKSIPSLYNHESLLCGVRSAFWPGLLSKLRNGEFHLMSDLSDANFVWLDEVVVEHDPSGFAQDKLSELLSCRVSKWTVITSNKTLQQLGDYDRRVTSRMVRGGSVVVGCDTIDWAMRKNK